MLLIFELLLSAVFLLARNQGRENAYLRDCQDVLDLGFNDSGVYHVRPTGTFYGFSVYCDLITESGGWLVFQRREDGSIDFYRDWANYESGFGNLSSEHWLGNLPLYTILRQGHYELRVDLMDWENNTAFAQYRYFTIGGPADLYMLMISGYFGNAGNAMGHLSGVKFSTKGRENDIHASVNCAVKFHGAWWYQACHSANLNAHYLRGNHTSYADGVNWQQWRGPQYSLKRTEMKIRRI